MAMKSDADSRAKTQELPTIRPMGALPKVVPSPVSTPAAKSKAAELARTMAKRTPPTNRGSGKKKPEISIGSGKNGLYY